MSFLPSRFFCYQVNWLVIMVAVLLLLLSSITSYSPLASAATGEQSETNPAQPAEKKDSEPVVDRNIAQLTPKTAELAIKLLDMQDQLNALSANTETAQRLESLVEKGTELEQQVRTLESTTQGSRQQLIDLQNRLKATERGANLVMQEVVVSVDKFDQWIDFWDAEGKSIEGWEKGLGASSELPAVISNLDEMQAVVDSASETINIKLLPLLAMQSKAGEIQVVLHKLILRVSELIKNKYDFDVRTDSLFSSAYLKQFDYALWKTVLAGVSRVFTPDFNYMISNMRQLLLTLLLFVVLSTILQKGRQSLLTLPHWRLFSERPRTVAFIVSLAFWITQLEAMSPLGLGIIRMLFLLSMLRLSEVILADTFARMAVRWFIFLLLASNLLAVIALPILLLRIYVLVVSVVLFGVVLLFIRRSMKSHDKPAWIIWSERATVLALGTVILAELSGKPDLAYFIFAALLETFFAALSAYILYVLIAGLLEIFLHLSPITYLKESAVPICAAIRPLLITGIFILLIIFLTVIWEIFPTAYDAAKELGDTGFLVQGMKLSIGLMLGAIVVLYSTHSISRMIQTILLRSVLPRQKIHRGTQISMVRLLHYAVMLMGFLFALSILGFNMTNLTILGGALGVGIGFGLQAIFSNFAAGLILLFERPIKVGDTIQVGTEFGEVRELGLRATVIETFDNAEIIVPNADLVTTQVTNWTLRRRQVRVKIPVGVAYGSEIDMVLKILKDCALEHPLVLSTPGPSPALVAFGASSLDFVLRCFIHDIDDRVQVQTELIGAIYDAFAEEGIEISFPQSDIHLRSFTPALRQLFTEK